MGTYWERRRAERPQPKIESLRVRDKQECPDCKKKFRTLHQCNDGKNRCTRCRKKRITNKWYVPESERKNVGIGKFNFSDEEKNQLHNQFKKQGLDSENAWKKVNYHISILRKEKARGIKYKMMKKRKEIETEQKFTEQRRKLLEGLK